MQQAMKIDEPDFGVLFDYMFVESGATLRRADYLDPKIEVELAFVLGHRSAGRTSRSTTSAPRQIASCRRSS